ncbi:MAG TPA: amidase [Dehalococcoidia bacterium]|jgi:aspartyl-tRNA(Asn)/glutamyl-tRNA(Gln) amidotransferase subunit A|nr:amidase [Dehalococcoidia bacterium]
MAMSQKPCDLTIAEAAAAMGEGKLSPSQLVSSCLERIDALEDKIQAWALVDRDGALETAQRLDQELRRGERRGPLHGIPVGIKDIFYTAGLRTEAGSPLWSGFVPSYDATVVVRLKEAGAIILGKTHTTEFAYLDPAPTRNPWHPEHTPGGSSSGSGAGVAAGMCLAALGSQTMGSVLRPAAYNGVVGFKPQQGRISTYGVVPLSPTLDHVGILARTVADAALIFQAIAGHDPRDYRSLAEPVPDCLSNLERQEAPRLGLVRQFFYEHADAEMRAHIDSVAEHLSRAGARVEEVTLPPSFMSIMDNARVILAVEAAAYHEEKFGKHREQYRPGIGKLIEDGLAISATEYARALETRLEQIAGALPLLEQVDALLTPGAPGAAPKGLASTGSPVMQAPWTIMGVPAVSLPTGLSQDGLPLAIQLAGPPLAEDRLLAVARWCERALEVRLRPPYVS